LGALGNPTGELVAGAINSVRVTLFGVGGYLNAWLDFNKNGLFDSDEHLPEITDLDLNPGVQTVNFFVPANLAAGPIPARFRWGTAGLDFFGPAIIGEVEDYLFANANAPVVSAIPGDYDGSGLVDKADYQLWKSAYHTSNLAADGNGDGVVDHGDYTVWRNHLGESLASGGGAGGGQAAPSAQDLALQLQLATLVAAYSTTPLGSASVAGPQLPSLGESPTAPKPAETAATDDASTATAIDLAAGGLDLGSLQFSTSVSLLDAPTVATPTESDLLLVDEVLAGMADDGDAMDDADDLDPIAVGRSDDGDERELALSAAFEENTDWWTSI
jgi:hypothetical protein